jgi:hypothetical protein
MTCATTSLTPGDRRQVFDVGSKGLEGVAHARLQLAHALLQVIHLSEVELEEEAVVLGDTPAQRLDQRSAAGLEPTAAQRDQLLRVGFASDERIEDRAPALAEDVADHAGDLDVRVLEYLLDPVRVLDDLATELLARSPQVTDLLDRRRWDEAATDQPVRE